MGDATRAFFERVNDQGFDARLGRVRGTLRIDVGEKGGDERWFIALDRGAVQVTHDDGPADCVVRLDRAVLDGIVGGTVNPTAALLRGVIWASGNFDLLLHVQRLFPAASDEQDRRPATAEGGRHE
jgi:hypothetical protein